MDFDPDRLARSPFLVGAIGALITAVKFTPGACWAERGFNVIAGAAAAGYISPALVDWLGMNSPSYLSGAAFLVGMVGMSLASAMLQAIKETPFGAILASWLSRAPKE